MITGIIGCERGGTSAVAVVCKALGVKMYGCDETLDDVEMFCKYPDKDAILWERGDNWGWKYPHKYGTYEVSYTDQFIVVLRDPVATAARRAASAGLSGEHYDQALREVLDWQQSFLTIPEPKLYVSYEKLIARTDETVQKIANFLGVGVTLDAISVVDDTLGYEMTKKYNTGVLHLT